MTTTIELADIKRIDGFALPDALRDTIARATHPRFGLIKTIVETPVPQGLPRFHQYSASLADVRRLRRGRSRASEKAIRGGALGCNPVDTLWAAVGESVERYSAAIYPEDAIVHGTCDSLQIDDTIMRRLIRFSPEMLADPEVFFHDYDPDLPRGWVRGTSLLDGAPVWLAAQSVVFNYHMAHDHELLSHNTSNGIAAGQDIDAARLGGLCEVIERDAFACHWMLRRAPDALPASQLDTLSLPRQVRALMNSPSHRLRVFDMRVDIDIPTILVVLSNSDDTVFCIGASCKPTLDQAVTKAVCESIHCWTYLAQQRLLGARPVAFEDISNFLEHAEFYLDPVRKPAFWWLTEGDVAEYHTDFPNGDTSTATLEALLERVGAAGHIPVWFDMTGMDAAQLGLAVGKVVVPGLQPLYSGLAIPDDLRRLEQAAPHLGLTQVELNRDPHPFP
ncbi:YcaO-like family protein [Actibacterium ureilyticum]|uniref:YcaO-like family protein n=1 Tax=Actibacterium ureilyticum TaxID=1590614 RepID=UPI000BAAC612|nr:YcaO-like family protein [Actibacterium ureilyticum]